MREEKNDSMSFREGVQEQRGVWQCTECGEIKHKEEEIYCWKCGKGEMIYKGKFWVSAVPVPFYEGILGKIKRYLTKKKRVDSMSFKPYFIIVGLFFSCSSMLTKATMTASTARIIEAYREAEQFEHPTEDRSLEWHALKYPQYGAWAYFGYVILDSKEPLKDKIVATAVALAMSHFLFELSLEGFR